MFGNVEEIYEFMPRISISLGAACECSRRLGVLSAAHLFPAPVCKNLVEKCYRSDPYRTHTVSGDNVAWVMHSQINARISDHSDHQHGGRPDAPFGDLSARTCRENCSQKPIKTD